MNLHENTRRTVPGLWVVGPGEGAGGVSVGVCENGFWCFSGVRGVGRIEGVWGYGIGASGWGSNEAKNLL